MISKKNVSISRRISLNSNSQETFDYLANTQNMRSFTPNIDRIDNKSGSVSIKPNDTLTINYQNGETRYWKVTHYQQNIELVIESENKKFKEVISYKISTKNKNLDLSVEMKIIPIKMSLGTLLSKYIQKSYAKHIVKNQCSTIKYWMNYRYERQSGKNEKEKNKLFMFFRTFYFWGGIIYLCIASWIFLHIFTSDGGFLVAIIVALLSPALIIGIFYLIFKGK